MPRVHGIEIIPRRGRGVCRHRATVVVKGVDNSANDFFEANRADLSLSQLHVHDEEMQHVDGFRMSLDNPTYRGSASHDGEGNIGFATRKTYPGSNMSGTSSDEATPAVDADTTKINVNGVSSVSNKGSISTSFIRPQPRESLHSIEFGSHSFSVQQISHKSSPSCSLDNAPFDSLRPSLESIAELPPLASTNVNTQTEQSRGDKGVAVNGAETIEDMEKANRVEALNTIHLETVEGATLTDANTPRNQYESEETRRSANQLSVPVRNRCPIDDDSFNESNTHWLIHRCSAACLQIESPLSPLELAIKILHIIRCITNEDHIDEFFQQELFALVLKHGKKRDLEFVFEVSERAVDLRDDMTLTEESLREAASIVTRNDIAKENIGAYNDNSDDYEIDAHPDLAAQPFEQLPTTSSPQVLHQMQVQLEQNQNEGLSMAHSPPTGYSHSTIQLSRRKKRQSNANSVILQGEMTSFASNRNNAPNREVIDANKEELHYVTSMDGLDLQDDEMWSFLPNTLPIDEMENDEQPPTQRITRSMNKVDNDEKDNSRPCHDMPSQVIGAASIPEQSEGGDRANENVAEVMETQVIDLNTKVTDVRIDFDKKDRVDDLRQSRRKNFQLLSEDRVHVNCIGSSNGDCEVYSMVKTRERNEGKGSVRIIFTGLNPSRRHMQMIETIGAEYVHSIEEAHTATHVIASDGITKLRRTPKLMICICRVAQILSIEWLEQSSKHQCILDTDDFLLLNDREAEKRYNFSMKKSLRNGIRARKTRGGVLGGWFVYICSGVAGNRAPSLKEIYLIIEAGGGQVLKSLSSRDAFDLKKTIVLTSDPGTKSQLGEHGVARAKQSGAKVMSTSFLFHIIITQNLLDIDVDDDARDETPSPATSHFADIDVCASPASMMSSISVKSTTPVKQGNTMRHCRLTNHAPLLATTIECNDSESVRTRGSRVSHLEHAFHDPSPEPKKRKLDGKEHTRATLQICSNSFTRDSRKTVLTSIEALSTNKDQAAYLTSYLWLKYFNKASKASLPVAAKKMLSTRPRKGVRCLRGRNRSISPLISCANPVVANEPTITNTRDLPLSLCNQLLEDNLFVTWESYILFTLRNRAETLNVPEKSREIIPACYFFPRPITIIQDKCSKHVDDLAQTTQPNRGLSLNLAASGSGTEGPSFEIFGTLQDFFSLYRQHQTFGMIPEQAIAILALQAIEAVAAMHTCGVVHNDIGLDSFLVVKKIEAFPQNWGQPGYEKSINSWYLQLIGFGQNAVVLNCRDSCQEEHFAYDYQCIANVIHRLITGGIEISLTSSNGMLDFSSKPYIKGNLFLRGALSWCSLLQSLLHVGELASICKQTSAPFRLRYPVDFSKFAASNDERIGQFGWSCRILQELCNRRVLNDLIDGLCEHNLRFTHPSTDLSKYGSSTCDERHSFTCYTSSDQTADHLMETESRLQSDHAAIVHRETAFKEEIAKFEQSKLDQQSVLRRESDVRVRENDLLQREREHAIELKQLEALREEIRATESRIERKLQLLKVASSISSCRPIHQQERNDRMSPGEPDSKLHKSQSHATGTSATKRIIEEPTRKICDHLHKNRIHITNEDTLLSHHKSPSIDPHESQGDYHEKRQHSQETTSSLKKTKKGSARKSPKCSLHFLPRSPQKTPKKVFVDLGEE